MESRTEWILIYERPDSENRVARDRHVSTFCSTRQAAVDVLLRAGLGLRYRLVQRITTEHCYHDDFHP